MPRISAVVCTHNGGEVLGKTLESLRRQTLASEDYEVVVVDNASSDGTADLIESARRQQENLLYEREERLGLSSARNTGMKIASAPFLAYLDDDARPEPQWLESLLAAFETRVPEPDCVGGPVRLDWPGNSPSWLSPRYWRFYSWLDLGDTAHVLGDREYLVGANMAFRKSTLLAMGGFDPALGRKGRLLLSGEESAILEMLRQSHRCIFYEPKAGVSHFVPPKRRSKRWLRSRVFWDGASQPLLDYGANRGCRFYLRQAYRDLRRMGRFGVEYAKALTRGDREQQRDSALALVQRSGRLTTNLNLAVGRDS